MKFRPLIGFWWKHGDEIEALFSAGKTPGGGHMVQDLATALVQFAKKTWPDLNKNGLLDDGLTTLVEAMAPDAPAGTITPGNDMGAGNA